MFNMHKTFNVYFVIIVLTSALTTQKANANDLLIEPSARYRYQQVQDPVFGDAIASTIVGRVNVTYRPADFLTVYAQADYVHAFNEDHFNSVTVTRATSPITDVPGGELNQAWLKYTSDYDWQLTLGRQHLNFNNERHISSVEFWQNDQTFDALTFTYNDALKWDITYSYISRVHRIFGDDAISALPKEDIRFMSLTQRPFMELGNHDHNTHLLNVNYAFNRYVELSSYAYLVDNQTASQLSSNTFGVSIAGAVKPDSVKYAYIADVAYQNTANKSEWDYAGYYVFAQISAQYKSHEWALGHERLTENNGFAFVTSLGNNHKFIGWVDAFSSYENADGIRDTFLSYRARHAKLRWRIMAHHFESDTTGLTAGHELDIEVGYRFTRKWEATLLASRYKSKGGIEGVSASQSDLSSVTLSVSYNF